MPFIQSGDARLFWRVDGIPTLPPLVLANSLGTDLSIWDEVLPRLLRHHYVIRYDMRGHGASDVPQREYRLEELADDLLAVVTAAGLTSFCFAGVSLGAMVGMQYALRYCNPAHECPSSMPSHQAGYAQAPQIEKLVLSNTAVSFPAGAWTARIDAVADGGMPAIADLVLDRFFTANFAEQHHNTAWWRVRHSLLSMSADGYAGCCAAIRDMNIETALPSIRQPALVLTGSEDRSTPPERGDDIATAIPGARCVPLAGAHIPMVELPLAWGDAVLNFLCPPEDMSDSSRYTLGLTRRRDVLGADYVDSRVASRTPFNRGFQQLITQLAWGRIWTSSRFDDARRRVMVMAITAALGRWEEFELHVDAALRAGLESEVIEETLFMVAVYAGVPAANTGFAVAGKQLAAFQRDSGNRSGNGIAAP